MLHETIKKFRLAVYAPRPHDATSLYRAMGPLSAMERQDDRLELRPAQMGPEGLDLSWNFLLPCDAVLVQRPFAALHARICVQAKMMGLPLWVDWDDDNSCVHPSNPSFRDYYGCEEMLDRITKLADIITVSTPALADARSRKAKTKEKFRVIPNAAQFPAQDLRAKRSRRVCWRGGASHEFDLLNVLPQLVELAKRPQFGRWDWCFLGDVPWQVGELMPKERLISDFGDEPFLYMEAMAKLLPWVHIVPLADNTFNRAKSNLAWIEATMCGAAVVAPDWPEWHRPGITNYKNKFDFAEVLAGQMANFGEFETHPSVAHSRDYIAKNLTLRAVNHLRWEVLNDLAQVNASRFLSQDF